MSDANSTTAPAVNLDIAERFREAADLLEAQDADPFRVRAYRQGASTLSQLDRSVETIYEQEGRDGLETGGQWRFLERLEGTVTPESVFQQVSGIGPELAERIHEQLGIDTLEALEQAAHDGRLDEVEGFGERRLQAVTESLEAKLRRRRDGDAEVPVAELLDVDREYQRKAARGELRRIAPRRFNPEGKAWLPILHTERDGRHYTALYSNTPRAHDLDKTHDWVVLYLEDEDQAQWTVVTETSGPLDGKRVVRGREAECQRYYEG